MSYKRIFLLILDGCGCGEQSDFKRYHSAKSNTLGSLYKNMLNFKLPALEGLGLSQLLLLGRDSPRAIYGKMSEVSKGNDTFAGVWEMMGQPFLRRFASRHRGFNNLLLVRIQKTLNLRLVGNRYISGYKALDKYYDEHVHTGDPIIYFSDDGVILFAGHADIIKPRKLNSLAADLSKLLHGSDYARIITRPFVGEPGGFIRLEKFRKDFIINASTPVLLKSFASKKIPVRITEHLHHLFGNPVGVSILQADRKQDLLSSIQDDSKRIKRGFFMYVFQETDNYGHKKDADGFRVALRRFDSWLGNFMQSLNRKDLLMITADHGCNPLLKKVRGHNREHVPLLIFSPSLEGKGINLDTRKSFADLGQTISRNFGIQKLEFGKAIHEVL